MFHDRTKVRDLALLTLMLGTGIRVSECVGLDLDDVDLKTTESRSTGKVAQKLLYTSERKSEMPCADIWKNEN